MVNRSQTDQRKGKLAGREEKNGANESRRLEGKGRKMKDPRSRWGDLCSHGLICPLIPCCVDRWVQSTLHCGFAKRGPQPTVVKPCQVSAVGLGASKSAWRTTLQTENNADRSRPLVKCYCLDTTQPYRTFKICQADNAEMAVGSCVGRQMQNNLHNSPEPTDPGITKAPIYFFLTKTLYCLITMYSTRTIIRVFC